MGSNHRFVLGTVQFGLPYGIANQTGQVSHDETVRILDYAWTAGISTLDTAINYGESEQRLGKIGVKQWRVISKLSAIPKNCNDVAGWVQKEFAASLDRLKLSKLYGLLLHYSEQLLQFQGNDIYQALVTLKNQGKVEKIGLSIYTPDELEVVWPRYQFDLIQAPFNVMDRRLVSSGWLKRLHQEGVEVHARSIFLQGLLLMEPGSKPAIFNRWEPLLNQWHSWLKTQKLTTLQGCLGFALLHPEIDQVVVGIDNLKHLQQILACSEKPIKTPPLSLMSEDLNLINPRLWKKL